MSGRFSTSSLARWGAKVFDLRRDEWPLAAAMFGYFFLVITTFWILKPLKKTEFIAHYQGVGLTWFAEPLSGSQAELLAKVANMVVAFVAALVFGMLARSLRREALTWVFCAFSALVLIVFALGATHGELGVWLFYLFGDLFNTLMLATFFAFMSDSFTPDAARRTYGPIVLGGVCGGAFGSLVIATHVDALQLADWLWVCVGLTLAVAVLAGYAGHRVRRADPIELAAPTPEPQTSAWAGVSLVAKSRYLLAIVAMVGLYELISTTLDFQFTATVEALVPPQDHRATFSTVYAVTNVFAMLFQLLATGWIMRRFGVQGALLVMPVVVAAASFAYLVIPTVVFASLLSASDNGLSYSLNQSAREALYTVTTRAEKYQAKAVIDMFVQRFAKALAVGLSLLLSLAFDHESLRWLSLLALSASLLWFFVARYAGRSFARRAPPSSGAP